MAPKTDHLQLRLSQYPVVVREIARPLAILQGAELLPESDDVSADATLSRIQALEDLCRQYRVDTMRGTDRFEERKKAKAALGSVPDLDPIPDHLHPLQARGVRRPGVPVDHGEAPVLVTVQPKETRELEGIAAIFRHFLLSDSVADVPDEVPS